MGILMVRDVSHELRDPHGKWSRSGGANRRIAGDIASKWNVSDSDLRALAREEGADLPASHADAKEELVQRMMHLWTSSSGHPIHIAAITHIADKMGARYKLQEHEQAGNDFIRSNPAMDRATRSLGEAIYSNTQDKLGGGRLNVFRAGTAKDNSRPFTSWSTRFGGTRAEPGRIAMNKTVPVNQVFSTAHTGFGNVSESEVVVLPSANEMAFRSMAAKGRKRRAHK